MLETAASWANAQLRQATGKMVTYRRGLVTCDLTAVVGRSEFESQGDYGVVTKVESRDYLVAVADLRLDDQQIYPMSGDRIEERFGETLVAYEVMAFGNEPCYRYSDPGRTTLRIHTKQIEVL